MMGMTKRAVAVQTFVGASCLSSASMYSVVRGVTVWEIVGLIVGVALLAVIAFEVYLEPR